nr:hypothetical protein [Kibdelosporangium sp. MJ126-NF4]
MDPAEPLLDPARVLGEQPRPRTQMHRGIKREKGSQSWHHLG